MPEEQKERMTFSQAMGIFKEAASKGYRQGVDLSESREALRVIIAYRIKAERSAQGITQAQLSERINTNPLTYRGYENCKSDIPTIHLLRIAEELKVSVDYLLGRTDLKQMGQESVEERLSRLEKLMADKQR